MGDITKIEWAHKTFSPWRVCTPKSPGCKNCYAARRSVRLGEGQYKKGVPRIRASAALWNQVRKWNKEAWNALADYIARDYDSSISADTPPPVRPRIFPSLCDPFDEEVPLDWFTDYMRLIFETPYLDHLLLTKRPELVIDRLQKAQLSLFEKKDDALSHWLINWSLLGKPPANVWVGASVEDQARADERIPLLCKIPAAVRFLSVEPLLEAVDLKEWISSALYAGVAHHLRTKHGGGGDGDVYDCDECDFRVEGSSSRGVHWVIVGGESGPGARPCNVAWISRVVEGCKASSVPVFVKQLGGNVVETCDGCQGHGGGSETSCHHCDDEGVEHWELTHKKGGDMVEWPEDLRVREFPKIASSAVMTPESGHPHPARPARGPRGAISSAS